MPNKGLLIGLGIALLVLGGAIAYRTIVDNREVAEETDLSQELDVEPEEYVALHEDEEVNDLLDELEGSFNNLVEEVFLMGDDAVLALEEDLIEIENSIQEASSLMREEGADTEEVREKLVNIQGRILQVAEKLVEFEE